MLRAIVLVILCTHLFCTSAIGEQKINLAINIQGLEYSAVITENTQLISKVDNIDDSVGQHYQGYIEGEENSWVRASFIDEQWQGVVSIHNAMHMFEHKSVNIDGAASVLGSMQSTPMMEVEGLSGSCGSGDHGMLDHMKKIELMNNGANDNPMVAEATYADFCNSEINGVCVIAEIEIAFDIDFQNVFGAQSLAQAMSILNIVDGHYLNDMKISIDAITIEMLSTDLFNTSVSASPTLNAGDLLTEIENKKNNAQIPFVSNNSALTHLVTGRDFEGGTLGVAYLGTVCQANGFSTGTSSVFYGNPANTSTYNIPLTAIVVSHELAHNLGALHDGVPAPNGNPLCPSNVYIMSPGIGPSLNLTNFSSCSIADVTSTLSNLPNPELCLDFPVDVVIDEEAGNSGPLNINSQFDSSYRVDLNNGFLSTDRVDLNGSINLAEARFITVTANGVGCTVSANGGTYSCSVSNPPSSFSVLINTQVNNVVASTVTITQNVSEQTADVQEVMLANNTEISTFIVENGFVQSNVNGGAVSPTQPTPAPVPTPAPTTPTVSDAEEGGGGSLGFGIFMLMIIVVAKKYNMIRAGV